MDRKSIIVLVIAFVLLVSLNLLSTKIFPPIPVPVNTNMVAVQTNKAATSNAGTTTNMAVPQPPSLTAMPTNFSAPLVRAGTPEQVAKLETPDAIYTFTSHGGGIKTVELKKYSEIVGYGAKQPPGTNQWVSLNTGAFAPMLALRGAEDMVGEGVYKLTTTPSNSVIAETTLTNGLGIIKEFQVSSNYLLTVRTRFVNKSSRPMALGDYTWVAGTVKARSAQDDQTLLGVFWYDGAKEEHVDPSWFDNKSFCVAGVPRNTYMAGMSNVTWTAVHNQFFLMALVTPTNQVATRSIVRRLDLMPGDIIPKNVLSWAYEGGLHYNGTTLAAGQSLDQEFTVYAGPKEYKTLTRFGHGLDVVMGYGGFFGWFAKALLTSMNGLYSLVPNYAIVIILITVIIKILFWPLTQASTRSMKRMQALQPQMKAIQEKFKDDPTKMNRKLMEFMKENKVSPMGGCLPMLLQIPVFIGFIK